MLTGPGELIAEGHVADLMSVRADLEGSLLAGSFGRVRRRRALTGDRAPPFGNASRLSRERIRGKLP